MIPAAPEVPGATHIHSGKVRDLYRLPDTSLLMVASDRISAYDFVLEPGIPDKGAILTQMSLWWFERLADIVPNHVLSAKIPDGLPAEVAARIGGRSVVCERLEM
jgi:phosphoribosylaminoimidazole-succinocarboxamide synthase